MSRLKQYTTWYLGYHALLDLEDGHLSEKPQEHIDTTAGKHLDPIKTDIAKAFAPPEPITFSSVGIGEITFETPIIDELKRKFAARLLSMKQNYDAAEARLFNDTNTTPSYLTKQTEELRRRLVELIEPHGINRSVLFVEKLMNYISQFQVAELRQLELQSVGDLDRRVAELEASGAELVDGKHAGFKSLESRIRSDRDAWDRSRGFLTALGVRPEPSKAVSDATRENADHLITDFQQNIARKLHQARRLQSQLRFLDRYREVLVAIGARLNATTAILTNKDKWGRHLGLVAQYESEMEQCVRTPRDPLEVYVYGRNSQEYAAFCEKLPNLAGMYGAIQQQLNTQIVPIIVDPDRSLSAELLREVLDAEVQRQVERELAGESITSYLQQLTLEGRADEVTRFWTALEKQSAWLGTVDSTRIKSDESKGFKPYSFIELEDSSAIAANEAARGYFGGETIQIVNERLKETIIVSRYEYEMPLFVHESAWDQLATEYERLVRSHQGQERAQEALAKYHTSRQFFYLNEPFDRISLIPEAEREHTLNLMLHLGIFQVDGHGFLECLQPRTGRQGFEMRRWLTDRNQVDETQAVMFRMFAANPSHHADLTEHLLNRTASVFSRMAGEQGLEQLLSGYLAGFADGECFPLIPETLLQNRLLRDTRFKNQYHAKYEVGYHRKLVSLSRSAMDRPPIYESVDKMIADGYVDPAFVHEMLHRWDQARGAVPSGDNNSSVTPHHKHSNGKKPSPPRAEAVEELPHTTATGLSTELMALLAFLAQLLDAETITKAMYDRKVREYLISPKDAAPSPATLLTQLQLLGRLQQEGVLSLEHYDAMIRDYFSSSSAQA